MDSMASMNCWGLTRDVMDFMWEGFRDFLLSLDPSDPASLKKEYYLPYAVSDMLLAGKCTVKAYSTDEKWYGVTYADDKERVKKSIGDLIENGVYPNGLWK